MIPVRRRCWSDSFVPENWDRTADSYRRAAGKAQANRTDTNSAKAQAERFARRRERDERFKKELLA